MYDLLPTVLRRVAWHCLSVALSADNLEEKIVPVTEFDEFLRAPNKTINWRIWSIVCLNWLQAIISYDQFTEINMAKLIILLNVWYRLIEFTKKKYKLTLYRPNFVWSCIHVEIISNKNYTFFFVFYFDSLSATIWQHVCRHILYTVMSRPKLCVHSIAQF